MCSNTHAQWQQLIAHDKKLGQTQAQDDDQSTAVPSDVLEGTVSDLSTWDAGNLEELGSCGVLSSAEMRAARLQKISRASGTSQAKSAAAAKTKAAPFVVAGSKEGTRLSQAQQVEDDDRSTAAPSEDLASSGGLSSAELRILRLQGAAQAVGYKAKPAAKAAPQTKAMVKEIAGSQLKSELDKTSREAIRDMGLWEYMPARNPVVTRNTKKGADWNVGFEEYTHTLGGVPDAKPVERPHKADEVHRHLDMQSREALKEMGLWEHMPAKNPVVTRQTKKGADWNIGFQQYEHTLGGVADSQPVERPHKADELTRRLDIQSRKEIKEMGLWEHMPARNPVVTRQSKKGADWHVGFGEYVHTLGGVPEPIGRR